MLGVWSGSLSLSVCLRCYILICILCIKGGYFTASARDVSRQMSWEATSLLWFAPVMDLSSLFLKEMTP